MPNDSASQSAKPPGLSRRAVTIALVLAAFFGWFIPIIDFKPNNTYLGSQHFAPGAEGALLILVCFNPLLARHNRK